MEKNKADILSGVNDTFTDLYDIVTILRGEDGCPWDKEQTAGTLRKSIIEEAYECVNEIDAGHDENLCEELGDLLLVVSMIIRIKEQEGAFTLNDVCRGICRKLIRRHPHVFGAEKTDNAGTVLRRWEEIKRDVEGRTGGDSILSDIPDSFPPLQKAYTIQKKAAKVGFQWEKIEDLWPKLDEETEELKEAVKAQDVDAVEGEVGDILFTVVNLSRMLKTDPSLALNRTNIKFDRRFREVEKRVRERGLKIEEAGLQVLDDIWNEVKRDEY